MNTSTDPLKETNRRGESVGYPSVIDEGEYGCLRDGTILGILVLRRWEEGIQGHRKKGENGVGIVICLYKRSE